MHLLDIKFRLLNIQKSWKKKANTWLDFAWPFHQKNKIVSVRVKSYHGKRWKMVVNVLTRVNMNCHEPYHDRSWTVKVRSWFGVKNRRFTVFKILELEAQKLIKLKQQSLHTRRFRPNFYFKREMHFKLYFIFSKKDLFLINENW